MELTKEVADITTRFLADIDQMIDAAALQKVRLALHPTDVVRAVYGPTISKPKASVDRYLCVELGCRRRSVSQSGPSLCPDHLNLSTRRIEQLRKGREYSAKTRIPLAVLLADWDFYRRKM